MCEQVRFHEGIRRIDAANAEDPRTEQVEGETIARELAFSRRVYAWVERLAPNASEELRLAARAHTLRRWHIPRDQYPKTRGGYHRWRRALAEFHADEAEKILRDVGYDDSVRARVRALITKVNWANDPEGRVLEDSDCLAFLELKLEGYVQEWGDEKTIDILKKTLAKMTPTGIAHASKLDLGPQSTALLRRATTQDSDGPSPLPKGTTGG